jgi:hypothetical protein
MMIDNRFFYMAPSADNSGGFLPSWSAPIDR